MTKIVCDRCGATIPSADMVRHMPAVSVDGAKINGDTVQPDLCDACVSDIKTFVSTTIVRKAT